MLFVVLLVNLIILGCVNSRPLNIYIADGYYWREYTGEIPIDAVPGGKNNLGKTTYIGQALHIFPPNGKLIPGIIDEDAKEMYYNWNDISHSTNKNVKILCSQRLQRFEWVKTDIIGIRLLSQDKMVLGGYDTDYPLFIGRKHLQDSTVLGKVTIQTPYEAFGYTHNGKAYYDKDAFEVLLYEPEKDSTDHLKVYGNAINIIVKIH